MTSEERSRLIAVAERLGKFKEACSAASIYIGRGKIDEHINRLAYPLWEAIDDLAEYDIIGPIFEDRFFDEFSATAILERMGVSSDRCRSGVTYAICEGHTLFALESPDRPMSLLTKNSIISIVLERAHSTKHLSDRATYGPAVRRGFKLDEQTNN